VSVLKKKVQAMNQIMVYKPDGAVEQLEVRIEDETVWLNRHQLAILFGRDIKTIGKHIGNVFAENELEKSSTVANFATVQMEGNREVKRIIEHYNLDVIISVGYRVKFKRGTQFRIWATNVLKDFLLRGYSINQRINRVENTVESLVHQMQEIQSVIEANQLPTQGVFFDGQIFDAYELTSCIIKSAKHSIVLIDNYVDESTLTHLAKKSNGVNVLLLTRKLDAKLQLDLQKVNEQYGGFSVKVFTSAHDRFLIIDQTEVYHLGASLKDLGKKWFAFSKLDIRSVESVLHKLK
jgi:hypothetical protein